MCVAYVAYKLRVISMVIATSAINYYFQVTLDLSTELIKALIGALIPREKFIFLNTRMTQ